MIPAFNDSRFPFGVRYRLSRAANGMTGKVFNHQSMKLSVLLILLSLTPLAAAQQKNAFAQIPFQLVGDEILVEVKIAGKGPFTMMLDTNTDPTAIDSATAKELGLIQGPGYPATGGGSEPVTVYLSKLPLVELGVIAARNMSAGIVDLRKLSEKVGRPIHGVLGYSFLKDRIVQIDYPESRIRIYDFTPYPSIQFAANTVNRIAVTFRYDGGVLIDSVFVNGQKLRGSLDTGSSATFTLTPEATMALHLEEEIAKAPTEETVGYNGKHETRTGILKSVRIGRLSLEGVPAQFWLPGTGHDKKKYDINIGNGFFKDYVVTFDFRNKLVVFDQP